MNIVKETNNLLAIMAGQQKAKFSKGEVVALVHNKKIITGTIQRASLRQAFITTDKGNFIKDTSKINRVN
jgi:hypothetical protein